MFERNNNKDNNHTIESNNILTCCETGRVVAVFYNDYDMNEILKAIKEREEFKIALKKIDEVKFGYDGVRGVSDILSELDL